MCTRYFSGIARRSAISVLFTNSPARYRTANSSIARQAYSHRAEIRIASP
jgi:hypothetical protein